MNGAVIPKIIWLVITFTPGTPADPITMWHAPDQATCERLAQSFEQFQTTRCIRFETNK